MTEEDTFIELARTPFDEVHRIVLSQPPHERNPIWINENKVNEFLAPHHWTYDTWIAEYNRRTKLGMDYSV